MLDIADKSETHDALKLPALATEHTLTEGSHGLVRRACLQLVIGALVALATFAKDGVRGSNKIDLELGVVAYRFAFNEFRPPRIIQFLVGHKGDFVRFDIGLIQFGNPFVGQVAHDATQMVRVKQYKILVVPLAHNFALSGFIQRKVENASFNVAGTIDVKLAVLISSSQFFD